MNDQQISFGGSNDITSSSCSANVDGNRTTIGSSSVILLGRLGINRQCVLQPTPMMPEKCVNPVDDKVLCKTNENSLKKETKSLKD